jgi:hypothetical protein
VPATSRAAYAALATIVTAAAALGVTGVEPAILTDGASVIDHLAPSPPVAMVLASTTAVRPEIDARFYRRGGASFARGSLTRRPTLTFRNPCQRR